MSRKPKPAGRKEPFDKGRSAQGYARRSSRRTPKRLILVVCEGKETEPRYFRSLFSTLRPADACIRVLAGGKAKAEPGRVVERAEEERRRLSWDQRRDRAWCVFDAEQAGARPELVQVVEYARRSRLHVAVSNPAFEYWFLLHYEATDRPFGSAQEVIAALQEHLPDYAKNMDVFSRLDGLTEQALANAQALRERSERGWEDFPCPSTGADLLVREVLGCARGDTR